MLGRLRLMRVHGRSMQPALRDGDLVIVGRGQRPDPPRRGDVIALRPQSMNGRSLVKRVIGVPGDHIALAGRRWSLKEDEFFVLGDQADGSTDSRSFGPVPSQEVIGWVWFRLWPGPQRVTHRNVPNFRVLGQDDATVG